MTVFKKDREMTVFIYDKNYVSIYVDPNTSIEDAQAALDSVKRDIFAEECRDRIQWGPYKWLQHQEDLLSEYIKRKGK